MKKTSQKRLTPLFRSSYKSFDERLGRRMVSPATLCLSSTHGTVMTTDVSC